MQICSKTQEFTQNSREIGQKTQFSGKSATLCLPENRPIKKPVLDNLFWSSKPPYVQELIRSIRNNCLKILQQNHRNSSKILKKVKQNLRKTQKLTNSVELICQKMCLKKALYNKVKKATHIN